MLISTAVNKSLIICCLALTFLCSSHLPADPIAKPTCAVLTFDSLDGVTPGECKTLSDRFRAELNRLGGYRLLSREKTEEILKAQEYSISENCSAMTCAIEVGKLLPIEYIVFGSIGKVGQTYTVNVSMANVESGEMEKSATYDLKGDIDGLLTMGMAAAARRLLGMEREAAASVVQSSKSGATEKDLAVDLGNGVKMEFVWIPPGEFLMGSPGSESGRDSNEGPQHRVTISKGFWMGKYEVTQEQWKQIMGNDPSYFKGALNPVEQVSWDDCQEFIARLNNFSNLKSEIHDLRFALPTEAQWEYACRAMTRTRFYTGDQDSDLARAGWYNGNSGKTTHPVGGKAANAWGLYDMHGNVWEWCEDWLGEYGSGAQTDPTCPSSGSGRVLRGGSWNDYAWACRSAFRGRVDPANRINGVGFRVVIVPSRALP